MQFQGVVSGRVRLEPMEFRGVLALLADVHFFGRVYIDNGVPAWPGDIDLAPYVIDHRLARGRCSAASFVSSCLSGKARDDAVDFEAGRREDLARFRDGNFER